MGLLDDAVTRRIIDAIESGSQVPPERWQDWTRALLDDRRARTQRLQRLARRFHWTRRRARQAAEYLDGLYRLLEEAALQPWPRKLPCPLCGAAVVAVRNVPRPTMHGPEHHILYEHPDGTTCELTANASRPDPTKTRERGS